MNLIIHYICHMNIEIKQLQSNRFYNDFHKHFRISVQIDHDWSQLSNQDALGTAQYFSSSTILLFRDKNISSDAHKYITNMAQRVAVNSPFEKISMEARPAMLHDKAIKLPVKIEAIDAKEYDILYWIHVNGYEDVVGLQQHIQEFMPETEHVCIYTKLKAEKMCRC